MWKICGKEREILCILGWGEGGRGGQLQARDGVEIQAGKLPLEQAIEGGGADHGRVIGA